MERAGVRVLAGCAALGRSPGSLWADPDPAVKEEAPFMRRVLRKSSVSLHLLSTVLK